MVSITLAFIAKSFMLIKYLRQTEGSRTVTKENQEETSFLIGINPDDCVSALIAPIRIRLTFGKMKCFNCYSEFYPTFDRPIYPHCGFC